MVVLSILDSIIESIQKAVKDSSNLDETGTSFIEQNIAPVIRTTFHTLVKYMPSLIGAAIHTLVKYMPSLIGAAIGVMTGASSTVSKNCDEGVRVIPRLADQVRSLRQNLSDLVSHIARNGKPVKTVIFIDDLDRVRRPQPWKFWT